MKKKSKSVPRIAAELSKDPSIKKKVKQEIDNTKLVSKLIDFRLQKNVTQKELATKMKCSPSKISRIESGNDFNLDWEEIIGYTKALGIKVNISFSDETLPVNTRIKQDVFKLHELLEELTDLVKQRGEKGYVEDKIHEFYGEVLMDVLMKSGEEAKNSPENEITY